MPRGSTARSQLPELPHAHQRPLDARAIKTREPLRVLLVDPDDETRAAYRAALELAGYDVVDVADGRDALVKALMQTPRLVITEVQLPALDGFALCEILRRDPATYAVPILIVTGDECARDPRQALAFGADAVLAKPAGPDALLSEADRLIENRSSEPAGSQIPGFQDNTPRPRPVKAGRTRVIGSRTHSRFNTTTPPAPPPDLHCPTCDAGLAYRYSHVGGVSSRHSEQWDYYVCQAACGAYEYRQRTRKLRRVSEEIFKALRSQLV